LKKAVAYARYSSDNQSPESIDEQLYDIRDWAAKNDCEILKIYTDEAETGTSDENRDDFLNMISESSDMEYDYVLVHKTNRFARNKWDAAIYKKMLRENDKKVIYVTQPMLNEETPEAMMLETFFEGMDQYYSLDLAREVMKGHKKNARACKHNGGLPALGFDVDKETQTYLINEREAQGVKIIFEMYDAGFSYDAIIRELNIKGFKTKTGRPFSKNSISDILRNEKYVGVYTYNRRQHKVKGKRNNRKEKPADQIVRIPGGMPQIIEQELWDRVQARIAGRKHNPGERARNKAITQYLLTGKIECGQCGFAMVGKNGGTWGDKKRYDYYICNNRERTHQCKAKMIRRDIIERQILEELEIKILNPEVFPSLAKEIQKGMQNLGGESKKELIYLKAEIAKVQVKINNMLELIEDGAGSKELAGRLAQRESEKAILSNRIQEIERKTKASTITYEMILAYLQKEYEALKTDDTLTGKGLIDRYVEKVIIYGDEFEVIFKLLHTHGGGGAYPVVCRNIIKAARDFTFPYISDLVEYPPEQIYHG
jgi:site-specific DNA recombinase